MSKRSKKAAALQEAISQILFRDWDPIGIYDSGPVYEYDSYIESICRLMVTGADEFKIIERLYQIETTGMGLKANRERLKSVAEKLIGLNISR